MTGYGGDLRLDSESEAALLRAADVLDSQGIDYALMGGVASTTVGRQRATHDIDFFLTRSGAVQAVDALAAAGFRTERTDERWLFKAFLGEVMVDLIFVSKGGVVLDEEMRTRRRETRVGHRSIHVLAPEDQILIKALAASEHAPRHWYDALAILVRTELDWDYLLRRAGPHPARILSVLLFARSESVDLPLHPLRSLFELVQDGHAVAEGAGQSQEAAAAHRVAARVREALATDPEVTEPWLEVTVESGVVTLRGRVATQERCRRAEALARRIAAGYRVENQVEAVS
ncbi:MAG: nucleotidyltransferase [Candidatus Dormibacteraeota bacterium]|nr:nucleotidyltransferase [Candidatus Dormibacteraeota bacterium]